MPTEICYNEQVVKNLTIPRHNKAGVPRQTGNRLCDIQAINRRIPRELPQDIRQGYLLCRSRRTGRGFNERSSSYLRYEHAR